MDEDNYQKIIFEFITIQKWDSIKEILTKKLIDPDIRDSAGNYLIHLLIYYNQIELLKTCLLKNINLNILDNNNFNIFYIPLKLNYMEIIELLITTASLVMLLNCESLEISRRRYR